MWKIQTSSQSSLHLKCRLFWFWIWPPPPLWTFSTIWDIFFCECSPYSLHYLWAGQLHHPHSPKKLASSRLQGEEDSLPQLQPSLPDARLGLLSQLYLWNRCLDLILHHDQLSACWSVHPGWGLPDDHLGPGQAQELQERVQRLSKKKSYHSICTLIASYLGCNRKSLCLINTKLSKLFL